MKLNVYAIFDSAASAFNTPFYMQNDGMAIRAFSDNINDESDQNTIAQHPEDFSLYRLGKYDDKNATFELEDTPKKLVIGVEMMQRQRMVETQFKQVEAMFDQIKKYMQEGETN